MRHLYKRPLYVVHIKIYTKKRNLYGLRFFILFVRFIVHTVAYSSQQ